MNPIIIGSAKLHRMDCMEYMRGLPDKYFDLAIVDPPYGINAPAMSMGQNLNRDDGWKRGDSTAVKVRKDRLTHGKGKLKNRILNTSDIDWDDAPPPPEYFIELFRVSKNQVIFGANYFWENLRASRGIGYWNKRQPWDNFSQFELIWTSFDCPAWEFKFSNTGGGNKDKKISPTQKPVEVYEYIIDKFAKTGDKLLDTHMGSASSVVAAIGMGFDIDGTEDNKTTFANLVDRVNYENQQVRLFA
jgi:site-specific DNA-methyltransferase (adenine-specific)